LELRKVGEAKGNEVKKSGRRDVAVSSLFLIMTVLTQQRLNEVARVNALQKSINNDLSGIFEYATAVLNETISHSLITADIQLPFDSYVLAGK